MSTQGIEIPECLNPVSRHAPTKVCYERGTMRNPLCVKFGYFRTASLEGQIYKNWVMERTCLYEFTQKLFIGRAAVCGECLRVPGPLKLFPRYDMFVRFNLPVPPGVAEEQVYENRSLCFCCTDLCNAEEGFELSKLENDESKGKNVNSEGWLSLKVPSFLGLVAFSITLHIHSFTTTVSKLLNIKIEYPKEIAQRYYCVLLRHLE